MWVLAMELGSPEELPIFLTVEPSLSSLLFFFFFFYKIYLFLSIHMCKIPSSITLHHVLLRQGLSLHFSPRPVASRPHCSSCLCTLQCWGLRCTWNDTFFCGWYNLSSSPWACKDLATFTQSFIRVKLTICPTL